MEPEGGSEEHSNGGGGSENNIVGGSVELLPNTCQVENKTVGNLARYISVQMMQGKKAARLLFSSENFLLTSLKTQICVPSWEIFNKTL